MQYVIYQGIRRTKQLWEVMLIQLIHLAFDSVLLLIDHFQHFIFEVPFYRVMLTNM